MRERCSVGLWQIIGHKTGSTPNKMMLGKNVFCHVILWGRERSGVSVTMEQLSELKNIPIMELRREELSDAEEVVIDSSKSQNQRVQSFFGQMKNPFAQNVGEYILQIGYAEGVKETLDDRMVQLVRKQTAIL